MELLKNKITDARKAFETLQEVLNEPYSKIARDAAIQRFEYTVEVMWKCLQLFLREREGIECYSPKTCLREAGSVGLIDEDETIKALEMIDDRNLTSHTYHEELAETIYRRLNTHAKIMGKLLEQMRTYSV